MSLLRKMSANTRNSSINHANHRKNQSIVQKRPISG